MPTITPATAISPLENIFNSFNTLLNTLSTTVNADTGWDPIPAAAGFTSAAEARVKAGVLYLRGQFTKNSGNIATSDVLGNLGNGYRPGAIAGYNMVGSTDSYFKVVIFNGVISISGVGGSASNYVRLDGIAVAQG